MSCVRVILIFGILVVCATGKNIKDDTSNSIGVSSISKELPPELVPVVAEFFRNFHGLDVDFLENELKDLEISQPCKVDVKYTLNNYFSTMWGLRMLDSNAKIPEGVLFGSFVDFGNFDECVRTEIPDGRFQAQHCMVNIDLSLSIQSTSRTFPLFYGVCVPSTCKAYDVEMIMKSLISIINQNAAVTVDPNNCGLKEYKKPDTGAWITVGVLVAFVLLGISSTIYDMFQRFKKNNNKPHQLWSAFSFYSNGKYLLQTTNDPSMMTSLFGLRTITMGWVILGHTYLNNTFGPIINLSEVQVITQDSAQVVISNSFLSVDTFFVISGMLVCFVFFRNIGKNRTFDQPLGYLHRFLRLTPSYAIMIAFEATLFDYIGNGPFWERSHGGQTEYCQKYWWSSVLYVQNYVNPDEVCLEQTWYLSADMQMYWISPLILYPMYLYPVLAVPFLGFLTLAACFVNFAVVYINELTVNFVVNPSPERMRLEYYPFHTRMAPWLVGLALGYLIVGIRAKKITVNLSPVWIACGWIMSTVLMTASFQAMDYFDQNPDYTPLEAAFYLAFHRAGWAIGLAWLIFACTNGYGGLVNWILSWTLFQPLAKLSYCAYLVHVTVQKYRIGSSRANMSLGTVDSVWDFMGDFVASNLVAVPLFLLFEQPFLHIDRYFLGGVTIFNWPKPRPQKPAPERDAETPETPPKDDSQINQRKGETES